MRPLRRIKRSWERSPTSGRATSMTRDKLTFRSSSGRRQSNGSVTSPTSHPAPSTSVKKLTRVAISARARQASAVVSPVSGSGEVPGVASKLVPMATVAICSSRAGRSHIAMAAIPTRQRATAIPVSLNRRFARRRPLFARAISLRAIRCAPKTIAQGRTEAPAAQRASKTSGAMPRSKRATPHVPAMRQRSSAMCASRRVATDNHAGALRCRPGGAGTLSTVQAPTRAPSRSSLGSQARGGDVGWVLIAIARHPGAR